MKLFLILWLAIVPSVLGAGYEEEKLTEQEQTIDAIQPQNEAARVDALAEQLQVEPWRVRELRNQSLGWGEVVVTLAMARRHAETSMNPVTFDQALQRVLDLRAQKFGYGKIAEGLGFGLGPVIHQTRACEKQIRIADRRGLKPGELARPQKVLPRPTDDSPKY